ncbi:MAG: class I SAM-dependent methyltransferase family protein [Candidatus Methanoperedenaceae archaeon]|nr:class I SAM-dependent methyltransferase family protein [Candidatus Methanoperedenaceae archaeon]
MKAVRIRIGEAETVRKKLLSDGLLDGTRKPVKSKNFIEIPVVESFEDDAFIIIEQEEPVFYIQKKEFGDLLDIPENEKEFLPSGWQILGDMIIVTLNPYIEERKTEIGRGLLALYPKCRSVLFDRGICGVMRQPKREIIAGTGETVTLHRENGCLFKIDAMKLMFSKGNLAEKKRMSKLGMGEIVVDMFAGIGYFSIPMAVHSKPEKIYSIEINPVSFEYLAENIRLNKAGKIIQPLHGDCAKLAPVGIAHRVIMGYLDGREYLEHGIRALVPGGILHYHEAVPEAVVRRPVGRIIEGAGKSGRSVEIVELHRIKKYAPGVWHVVVDARVG